MKLGKEVSVTTGHGFRGRGRGQHGLCDVRTTETLILCVRWVGCGTCGDRDLHCLIVNLTNFD